MEDTQQESSNAKLAAALFGGYVLGRTKKGKWAMRVANYINPGGTQQAVETAKGSLNKVAQNEDVKAITEQIKGPLMEALQDMVTTAVKTRVHNLSSRIQERTDAMNEVTPDEDEDTEDAEEPEEEPQDSAEESDEGEDEEESEDEDQDSEDSDDDFIGEELPPARSRPRKTTAKES